MNKNIAYALCLSLVGLLSACGGGGGGGGGSGDNGGGGNPPASMAVTPSLGKMSQYRIDVFSADGETLLGSATVADEAAPVVQLSEGAGPFLVVVTALADAQYFDEALGTVVSLPEGRVIHAVANTTADLGVTPLTELAYQLAQLFDLFPLTTDRVQQVNAAVQRVLAPGLENILLPPTVLGAAGVSSLADDPAGRYGLVLAALAYLGENDESGRPALASLDALLADLADGRMDELNASVFRNALDDAAEVYGYEGDVESHVLVEDRLILREVSGSNSDASACSELAGIEVGTRVQAEYHIQEPGIFVKFIQLIDSEVLASSPFNGNDVVARESLIQSSFDYDPDRVLQSKTVTEYLSAEEDGTALNYHGERERQTGSDPFGGNYQTDTTITNTPAFRQRYNLQRGETYSQTYERAEQITSNNIPVFFGSAEVTEEITYLGRETLKVPAGIFETCRFHIYSGPRQVMQGAEVDTTDEVHDYWLAVGSGVLVLRLDDVGDELERELHSLTIESPEPVAQ